MSREMQAVVTLGAGGPEVLDIRTVERPIPTAHQLLVRVRAAALNHADMLQRQGEFPPSAGESEILGVEIAGDVAGAGAHCTTPIGTPVFGLVGGGGYAEYCVIDEGMAIQMPSGMSYAEAAACPEVFFTANTTLFELGDLRAGQTVLIHGGGSGLGSIGIQMARHVGAQVACTVGSEMKAARARELGASLCIDYSREDFVTRVRGATDDGADLVQDIVGAAYLSRNLAALKPGGCLLLVGVMSGTLCQVDLDAILMRRLKIAGSVMRPLSLAAKRRITRAFRERWLPELVAGRVRPVIDSVMSLSEVRRAHERLGRSEHFGKIVLSVYGAGACAVGRALPAVQQEMS
jgi:NADPH:quinone reductase